jgi:hypothetical protein
MNQTPPTPALKKTAKSSQSPNYLLTSLLFHTGLNGWVRQVRHAHCCSRFPEPWLVLTYLVSMLRQCNFSSGLRNNEPCYRSRTTGQPRNNEPCYRSRTTGQPSATVTTVTTLTSASFVGNVAVSLAVRLSELNCPGCVSCWQQFQTRSELLKNDINVRDKGRMWSS